MTRRTGFTKDHLYYNHIALHGIIHIAPTSPSSATFVLDTMGVQQI
jgi:hypothetical protein